MIQHRRQHIHHMFHTSRKRIEGINIIIRKIRNLTHKRIPCVYGAIRISLHHICVIFHRILCVLHVINCFRYQVMQLIDCISERFRLVNLDKRLHLPRNAANILASIHRSIVHTKGNDTGLTSGDTADIVARMFIAHRSLIGTP